MADETESAQPDLVGLTADLVSAYLANNHVRPDDVAPLITSVHVTLAGLVAPPREEGSVKATPAQIKKSITPGHLISFEDGKPYKTLRRHLTLRGLSPEAYRAKWGLPNDYPMTSEAYSEHRSALARALGLGQQRRRTAEPMTGGESEAPAKPRGRREASEAAEAS
ncbi:MucR family transcriptional regulator [Methylorubrum aminovorans]|jgi:predicted transcriptional regulator|uniref:MucR family transcriptional regulator n=1 Tax=Methylorubrum aminovorans TaxID=269069 RepID=UPI003C303417